MRRRKIICFLLCFLVCCFTLVSPAKAADSIARVEAFDELDGDMRYVGSQYREAYHLDIEQTGLLDAGDAMLNNFANVLFGIISTLASLAVNIFYFAMDFDLVALFADQIGAIQSGLKSSIFDTFFILAFCGTAWVMMTKLARRDMSGILLEGGKVIVLTLLAAFVVTNSAAALSGATSITKTIGTTALMEINNQSGANVSQYAASAGGMIWKGLVHDPWLTLQFGNTDPANDEVEAFFQTPAGTDERAQLVTNYQEAHSGEDSKVFSKSLGISRIGFLLVYLIPFAIKTVLFIVMALLQVAYQLMAVLFVLLAPVILLLAMLPTFGVEFVSNWLKKILETQIMVLVLTFIIGVVLKLDNLLYSLSGTYGWFVVAIMEAVICLVLLANYKKLLGGISKINEAARQPRALKYRMQKYGDATQVASNVMGSARRSVHSMGAAATSWMQNRPEYTPEPQEEERPREPHKASPTRKAPASGRRGEIRPTTEEQRNTGIDDINTAGGNEVQGGNKIERPRTTPEPPGQPPMVAAGAGASQDTPPAAERPRTAPEPPRQPPMAGVGVDAPRDTPPAAERPRTAPEPPRQPPMAAAGAGASQDTPPAAEWPRTAPEPPRQPPMAAAGAGASQDTPPAAERPKTATEPPRQPPMVGVGVEAPRDTPPAAERPRTAPEPPRQPPMAVAGAGASQGTPPATERPTARQRPSTSQSFESDNTGQIPHVKRPSTTNNPF